MVGHPGDRRFGDRQAGHGQARPAGARLLVETSGPQPSRQPSPPLRSTSMATETSAKTLTDLEIVRLRRLVEEIGERRTTELLLISRSSLQRLLARLPSQRGTVVLVRQQLAATRLGRGSGERITPT